MEVLDLLETRDPQDLKGLRVHKDKEDHWGLVDKAVQQEHLVLKGN